jgi:hypothetical protein
VYEYLVLDSSEIIVPFNPLWTHTLLQPTIIHMLQNVVIVIQVTVVVTTTITIIIIIIIVISLLLYVLKHLFIYMSTLIIFMLNKSVTHNIKLLACQNIL